MIRVEILPEMQFIMQSSVILEEDILLLYLKWQLSRDLAEREELICLINTQGKYGK